MHHEIRKQNVYIKEEKTNDEAFFSINFFLNVK